MYDEILKSIAKYPVSEQEVLSKAFYYAKKAHEGQKRASGEEYFTHPVAVAQILIDLGMDYHSVAASFLHDVIEDTPVSEGDIKEEFGEEILELVVGVTKLDKIEFKSQEEEQAENFKKIFVSMAKDIRVIIIKLADRLHNMRSLNFLSHERQLRMARETLDIYAPLAGRLGISQIKCELEDLCLKYLDPDAYEFLSVNINSDSIRIAYEKGVSDYITRPFDARNVYRRVANTIKVYSRQRRLISEITRQTKEKERSRSMMLEILSQIIERPSGGEEGSHTTRITEFTRLILERLICKNNPYGFTGSDVSTIAYAAAMHDMGKSRIDPEIVNKKGKLTSEEYETMKNHTVYGSEMLEKIKSYADEPLVKYAREICLCHHERYDGNGYPNGLKGDEIPVSAQVVSICDVYDALVSKRPYKPAYTHERAIEMIKNGECGSFNPLILECFYERADDFKKITERGKTIDE